MRPLRSPRPRWSSSRAFRLASALLCLAALAPAAPASPVDQTLADVRLLAERVTGAPLPFLPRPPRGKGDPPHRATAPETPHTPTPFVTHPRPRPRPSPSAGEGPGALIVVTFVNEAFHNLLLNWVVFARRANVTRRAEPSRPARSRVCRRSARLPRLGPPSGC